MLYFLDQDLSNNKTYVSMVKKFEGKRVLIEFDRPFIARSALKKLEASIIKGPMDDPKSYEPLPSLGDGKILVFRYLGEI